MIHLKNILPLTDFKRNTSDLRAKLKKSGLPAVLTVEGRPELVVQDAAAYQRLLDALEHSEAVEGIRAGLDSMKRGKGKPASQAFADIRNELGLRKNKRS